MRLSVSLLHSLTCLLLLCLVRRSIQKLESGLGSQDEVKLVEYLFKRQGYNPLIRPVKNLTETVVVKFGLAMIQLISVDEKNQIMKSNVWLRMEWRDKQLAWDEKDFNLKEIRIPTDMVWNPDIVLLNNADGKFEASYKCRVVIYSSGRIIWIPPSIYKSSCTMDVEYFPFDEQICRLEFASWIYNSNQLRLDWYDNASFVNLNDYVYSGTWDMIDCPAIIEETGNDGKEDVKEMMIFFLKLRRKPLFYTVNMIVPCVLISFLSACVFYLPADAGEKMTMCVSIMLALVVFILLLSKILPPTSVNVPLIAKFLLFAFMMNILSVLVTVLIVNWNFRTPRTHRLGKWTRIIFLYYLPKLLFMKRPNHEERWDKTSPDNSNIPGTSQSELRNIGENRPDIMQLPGPAHLHHPQCPSQQAGLRHQHSTTSQSKLQLSPEMSKAVEAVRFVAAHLKNEDDYSEILEDWRYIAMVIDRLQLFIFVTITIGGTIAILINAPFSYVNQDDVKIKYSVNA